MTSHVWHADVHAVGLVDGCPRCAEHAEHPRRALDAVMLAQLARRIAEGRRPRSNNEAKAMERLLEE